MNEPSSKRIHVLHVVLSLDPGGLENGVVNVINGLDQSAFFSSVCCLKHSGAFADRIRVPVTIFEMNLTKGNDFMLPLRLAKRLRQLKPDIVHTRNPESYFYGFAAAKLAGVKAIVHSEHGRDFPESFLRRNVQRAFSTFTDKIFALTQDLRRGLIEHIQIPPSKVEVIYNGVDLDRFRSGDRLLLKRRLGLDNELIIGSVGRLVPIKNYALLIRALGRLPKSPDAHLVFVGDGVEHANLSRLATELGLKERVHFLGHQERVHELVAGMDIFVLPSFNEGMSNTLIEAQAAGVVCVASDVGGNPEVVRDGVDGLLFPSNDADQLTERLSRLCENSDLRSQMARVGRERAFSTFALDRMIADYAQLYRQALHRA